MGFCASPRANRAGRASLGRASTIAHELGHFLLPWHGAGAQCAKADLGVIKSKDPNREREAEANRFAAALLMPGNLFTSDIRRLGAPETEHILKLARRYQVSKEAAARRYSEFCDHVCAVVFSHEGKLRSFCKTQTFPFLALGRGEPLPRDSISATAERTPGEMSEWSEVPAEVWLSATAGLHGKTVYEQFLQQANGYRLTMITIETATACDEPDEEEELEESWAVRFRGR